jgi:two-component system, sensor histidine kinase PdtaS
MPNLQRRTKSRLISQIRLNRTVNQESNQLFTKVFIHGLILEARRCNHYYAKMKIFLTLTALIIAWATVSAQSQTEALALYAQLRQAKTDTARLGLLLRLATYQIMKPGEFKADLDSAAGLLRQAENINATLKDVSYLGYINLVNFYLADDLRKPPAAKRYLNDAIRYLTASGKNYNLLGEAWYHHCRYYSIDDSTIRDMQGDVTKAASYFQMAGNVRREAECRQFLGDILQVDDQFFRAQSELRIALRLYQSLPDANLEGVYDLLGYINYTLGDYRESLRYGLLAYKTGVENHDTTQQMSTICGRLALPYYELKEYGNALIYFKKALALAEKLNDTNSVYILGNNTAVTLLKNNEDWKALDLLKHISSRYPQEKTSLNMIYVNSVYLQVYTQLKRYTQANKVCTDQLAMLANRKLDFSTSANHYSPVIQFYIASKQYDKARKYVRIQNMDARKINSDMYLAKSERLWFELDTSEHLYKSAVSHLLQDQVISNRMLDEKKVKDISNLEMEYETEKKETAIKIQEQHIQVLTQEALLQQANLKRADVIKNGMFAGAGLLLVILALVFYQYRLKQTANKIILGKNRSMEHLLLEKENLLEDKEVLMKEIHHRVKNNLHMISSLLESQSAYLENEALYAIQKSQHRVQAISLIHQKLYINENVTDVQMPAYLREIVSYLRDSFLDAGSISFLIDLDPVHLDVAQAVPVGLIVNEAITNAIKYAFPHMERGTIEVSLKAVHDGQCILRIADNGIGLTGNFDGNRTHSLGMNLIRGLGKSLHGKISIISQGGTTIELAFSTTHVIRNPGSVIAAGA